MCHVLPRGAVLGTVHGERLYHTVCCRPGRLAAPSAGCQIDIILLQIGFTSAPDCGRGCASLPSPCKLIGEQIRPRHCLDCHGNVAPIFMPLKPPNSLLHGALDALILKTLAHGPCHGYAIARFIEETTGEAVLIEEGSLYPSLYRMERRGWVEAEWGLSELGRRAKLYASLMQVESNWPPRWTPGGGSRRECRRCCSPDETFAAVLAVASAARPGGR